MNHLVERPGAFLEPVLDSALALPSKRLAESTPSVDKGLDLYSKTMLDVDQVSRTAQNLGLSYVASSWSIHRACVHTAEE